MKTALKNELSTSYDIIYIYNTKMFQIKYNDNTYDLEQLSKYSNYFKSLMTFPSSEEFIDFSERGKEMYNIMELLHSDLNITIEITSDDEIIELMHLLEEMLLSNKDVVKQIRFVKPEIAYNTLHYITNNDIYLQNTFPLIEQHIKDLFDNHLQNVIKSDKIFTTINRNVSNYEYDNKKRLTRKQKNSEQFMKQYYKNIPTYPTLSIYNDPDTNIKHYVELYNMIKIIKERECSNEKLISLGCEIKLKQPSPKESFFGCTDNDFCKACLDYNSLKWLNWNPEVSLNSSDMSNKLLSQIQVPFDLNLFHDNYKDFNYENINIDKLQKLKIYKCKRTNDNKKLYPYKLIKYDKNNKTEYSSHACYDICEHGTITELMFLISENFQYSVFGMFISATKYGNITILEWLESNHGIDFITKENYMSMCDSYDDIRFPSNSTLTEEINIMYSYPCRIAAKYHQWEALKWLFERKPFQLSNHVFNYIASSNSLDMMRWAFEVKCPYKIQDVSNNVAVSGNLEIIRYIFSKEDISAETKNSISQISAEKCNWDILSWCLDNKYCTTNSVCTDVAKDKNWDLLKKCIQNGLVWEKEYRYDSKKYNTCILSAKNKQWDILKFAYENNNPLSELVFSYIAQAGNFEMLNWALKNKCPKDKQVFSNIALTGDLDMLNWAVEHKIPFDDSVFENLVDYMTRNVKLDKEHILHLLEWGKKNLTFDKNTICKFAMNNNDYENEEIIMNWLDNDGASYDIIYDVEPSCRGCGRGGYQDIGCRCETSFNIPYDEYGEYDYYSYCCNGQGD